MALTEISPNVRRHSRHHAKPSPAASHLDSSTEASSSLTPGAVQSMLRTSTETGEIGQFSVRQPRIPKSGSRRQILRPRSGSFDSSIAPIRQPFRTRSYRVPAPRQTPSFSSLARQATTRSNLTSYHRNPRRRVRAPQYPRYGLEEVAGLRHDRRGLYGRPPLGALRRPDLSGLSSNSYSTYSASGRQPAFPKTPPMYLDGQRPLYHMRPSFDQAPSVGTAGSSPASTYQRRKLMPGYYPDMNRSATSVVRLPSPAVSLLHAGNASFPLPFRTGTPSSCPIDSISPPNEVLNSLRALHSSPTGSTIPLYYDYTESFGEEDSFGPDQRLGTSSPPFSVNQTIPEHESDTPIRSAQTPFGTVPGSVFQPVELPTEHSHISTVTLKNYADVGTSTHTLDTALAPSVVQPEAIEEKNIVETHATFVEQAQVGGEDDDPSRSSCQSRRTCPSSPSTSFFPNTTRSPRNLTNLAARVHSPGPDAKPEQVPTFRSLNDFGQRSMPHCNNGSLAIDPAMQSWQLPSVELPPLPTANGHQSSFERPKSSEGLPSPKPSIILSPTPERPMSSQSRRRFNKILSINDDISLGDHAARPVARSYNSLNLAKLKKVIEVPENRYSARFSIPLYSPADSASEWLNDEMQAIEALNHQSVPSCESTSNEKSTVDSLLDKHIACLGLQPDPGIVSTPKNHARDLGPRGQSRPNRLLADFNSSRLVSAQSVPCMSARRAADETGARQSMEGRKWSASTQLYSPSSFVPLIGAGKPSEANKNLESKFSQRLDVISCSQSPSHLPQNTGELKNRNRTPPTKTNLCEGAAHKVCETRKKRIRLKMKRDSLSYGKLADDPAGAHSVEVNGKPAPYNDHGSLREASVFQQRHELELKDVLSSIKQHDAFFGSGKRASVQETKTMHALPPASPPVSGAINRSCDLDRKPSMRTVGSHHSHTSQFEPINNARMSAQVSRHGIRTPRLAAPDLGPPLTSLNMNMDSRFPLIRRPDPPLLRATRSFFSDDSSAVHHHRGSLRKRFSLQGLKSGLRPSPRASNMKSGLQTPPSGIRSKPRHVHPQQTDTSVDEERDLYGTVGMTEFAYRKRKVIEKLKDWWRRHIVPMTQGLRKKRSEKDILVGRTVGA